MTEIKFKNKQGKLLGQINTDGTEVIDESWKTQKELKGEDTNKSDKGKDS